MVFSDPLAPHIDMAKLHYNEQFAITDGKKYFKK